MLSSSRALAHTPWRPVVAGITNRSALHLARRLSSSAAATRSQLTFIFDPPEERHPVSISSGKNLARNYTTSSQNLQQLVEEAKYAQATAMLSELRLRGAQIHPHPVYAKAIGNLLSQRVLGTSGHKDLIAWFELLPDAQNSSPSLFQGMLDDLRNHAEVDLAFTGGVGRVLARKGYKALVEDVILPAARKLLANDRFVSFEQELSRYLADSGTRINNASGAGHSEVFEDQSEDYVSVMAASVPPPPSVLDIVEATLPPVLPPPELTDQSVFEDELNEDYIVYQSASQTPSRKSPTDQLLHLVGDERYHDALHLLDELNDLHMDIPLSHAYGTVALEVIRRTFSETYTPHDQYKQFFMWLSLVPFAHESSGSKYLDDIKREILDVSYTNIPILMLFCSILVEKGYADLVKKEELAVIMRFAHRGEALPYIQQLEAANSSYLAEHQPEYTASQATQFSQRIRDSVVQYLAYSGKVNEAIALLPERGSEVKLSTKTYDKLLRELRRPVNSKFNQHLLYIKSLRELSIDGGKTSTLQRLLSETEKSDLVDQLYTSSEHTPTDPLPETLRYLKRALRKTARYPHPFLIAEFLQQYLSTGRTSAPSLLLHRALKTGFRSTSIFVFAEMFAYRCMGQPHLVVQTFVDHFYLSGVPREEVMKAYLEGQSHLSHSSASAYEEPPSSPTRMCKFSPSDLPQGKAWPMRMHCNLVWHALVDLTHTPSELENLYNKLRLLGQGEDSFNNSKPLSSLHPLLPPPSWSRSIDYVAFTPFMRRLMHYSGAERGARIINDMLELGIQPSTYHYTELAGFYARQGKVDPALNIMNSMEKASGLIDRLTKQRQTLNVPRASQPGLATVTSSPSLPLDSLDPTSTPPPEPEPPQTPTVPEPDLVFYTSIMRGFIISKCIQGFEKVHSHLQDIQQLLPTKKFGKDQQAILNETYGDFRTLCRKMRYDWKGQRKAGLDQYLDRKRSKRKEM